MVPKHQAVCHMSWCSMIHVMFDMYRSIRPTVPLMLSPRALAGHWSSIAPRPWSACHWMSYVYGSFDGFWWMFWINGLVIFDGILPWCFLMWYRYHILQYIVYRLKHLIIFGAPPLSYRFLESASKATCKAAVPGSAHESCAVGIPSDWLWMT
jgi:hypothetical protein